LQETAKIPISLAMKAEGVMNRVLEGEILGPELTPEEEESRLKRVRDRFFVTLRKAMRYIPFADEVVAAYFCALDPTTPHRVRGTILAALAYFVLPTDMIPDFLVGIGFGDDATILLAAITMVRSHISPLHREAARRFIEGAEDTRARR
jgi:uncharacterized membrane protein YkvA (DUF1232 family)